MFNNVSVSQSSFQKNLGVIVNTKLIFDEHLKVVSTKTNKTIGLLRRSQNLAPKFVLVTIYNFSKAQT